MPFTDEQIGDAYEAAPAIIQDALSGDELVAFGEQMETVYHLHLDTIGAVGDLIRNLLIGLINPTEFVTGMKELGITSEMVQQLTADLNQKIFIPLQQKMKEVGETASQTNDQVASTNSAPEQPQPAPAPEPVAPVVPPTPVAAQIASVVRPPVRIPPAEHTQPAVRTMATDIKVVQEAPQNPMPMPQQRPQSAPYTPLTPRSAQANDQHREELKRIVKEYGADPYREPVQ